MSLTGHLAAKSSPVRRWFEENLPCTRQILAGLTPAERGRVETAVVLPQGDLANYPYGTVGGAVDYRLRMMLGSRNSEEWLATVGDSNLRRRWRRQTLPAFDGLIDRLENLLQVQGQLELIPADGDATEGSLVACCFALALYEQCYRALPTPKWPVVRLGPDATTDEVLALCAPNVIDDLVALSRVCAKAAADLRSLDNKLILNPTFAGSAAVGGADADLISGSRLVEIKTSKEPQKRIASTIRQLVGYVLLDPDDEFGLEEVACFLPRQDVTVVWPIDQLLDTLAGKRVRLDALRASFKPVLDQLSEERERASSRWAALLHGYKVVWEHDFFPSATGSGQWHVPSDADGGDEPRPTCGAMTILDQGEEPIRPTIGTVITDIDARLCRRCARVKLFMHRATG